MRSDLDHLPLKKQRELARTREILFEEFEATSAATPSQAKKQRRILKIVLFGSYARGDWVEDPAGRYFSDYDLLIVVSHKELTDETAYWYTASDRLLHDKSIKTPVNIIVHTLPEVNDALRKGQYFFTDILRDGVMLYELSGKKKPQNKQLYQFVSPKPLSPQEAYDAARKYFVENSEAADRRFRIFQHEMKLATENFKFHKDAAFTLHQVTERIYTEFLLTETLYVPKTHNLEFLRSLSENEDARLIAAWPRDQRRYQRRFQLLKRAYVEARYSEHYQITQEELRWLGARVAHLQQLVKLACEERLAALKKRNRSPSTAFPD